MGRSRAWVGFGSSSRFTSCVAISAWFFSFSIASAARLDAARVGAFAAALESPSFESATVESCVTRAGMAPASERTCLFVSWFSASASIAHGHCTSMRRFFEYRRSVTSEKTAPLVTSPMAVWLTRLLRAISAIARTACS